VKVPAQKREKSSERLFSLSPLHTILNHSLCDMLFYYVFFSRCIRSLSLLFLFGCAAAVLFLSHSLSQSRRKIYTAIHPRPNLAALCPVLQLKKQSAILTFGGCALWAYFIIIFPFIVSLYYANACVWVFARLILLLCATQRL